MTTNDKLMSDLADAVERLLSVMESRYPFLSNYMDSHDQIIWQKQTKVSKAALEKYRKKYER